MFTLHSACMCARARVFVFKIIILSRSKCAHLPWLALSPCLPVRSSILHTETRVRNSLHPTSQRMREDCNRHITFTQATISLILVLLTSVRILTTHSAFPLSRQLQVCARPCIVNTLLFLNTLLLLMLFLPVLF